MITENFKGGRSSSGRSSSGRSSSGRSSRSGSSTFKSKNYRTSTSISNSFKNFLSTYKVGSNVNYDKSFGSKVEFDKINKKYIDRNNKSLQIKFIDTEDDGNISLTFSISIEDLIFPDDIITISNTNLPINLNGEFKVLSVIDVDSIKIENKSDFTYDTPVNSILKANMNNDLKEVVQDNRYGTIFFISMVFIAACVIYVIYLIFNNQDEIKKILGIKKK